MNLYNYHLDPKSLKHHDFHHDTVIELIWDTYKNNPGELKKRERCIAKDSWYAYLYASEILHGRFPAGEAAIATNPVEASRYATDIIKGPWKPGEAAIATSPMYAYFYASEILHRRFPAGEAAIATSPRYASKYAKNVIKGPWHYNGKTFLPKK